MRERNIMIAGLGVAAILAGAASPTPAEIKARRPAGEWPQGARS